MSTLLIVSGSRTCADDEQKTLWVQTELMNAMRFMGPKDAVLSGASPGRVRIEHGKRREEAPDLWARELAMARKIPMSEFRLDGYRWINGKRTERTWRDLAEAAGAAGQSTPLARNRAMIEAGRRAMAAGWDVWLIGFIDPASTTFGTGYTCKHAAPVIPTCALTYPMLIEDAANGEFVQMPDLLFVDTETTAASPAHGMMIELAAVRCHPKTLVEKASFETKVAIAPWALIERVAMQVNRYSPEEWEGAPSLHDALNAAIDAGIFDAEPQLVAYNTRFDRRVLEAAFARCGATMPTTYPSDACVYQLAKKMRGLPRYRLEDVCNYFGVSNLGSHRAMEDVRRTIAVYPHVLRTLREQRASFAASADAQ